jgi:tRNA(Ile2) C34 agmatinyltransferase TiaS
VTAPLLIICGYCRVEMQQLPSGSWACPKCGRWATKDQQPPAPPTP